MTEPRHESATLPPLDIASAARAFLCRSGDAETELRRRLLLRDTVGASRTLAHALEQFATHASDHGRDVHCTSHLDADVEALEHALATWRGVMSETAAIYHECQAAAAHPGAMQLTQSPRGIHARQDDLAAAGEAV